MPRSNGALDPAGMLMRSAGSSMDRASDYGSEGWGFDSLPARKRNRRWAVVFERTRGWLDAVGSSNCKPIANATLGNAAQAVPMPWLALCKQ